MFSLSVINAPVNLAVKLDTVRKHCRISQKYDDDLLTAYIQTATNLVEAYTARALITQTL